MAQFRDLFDAAQDPQAASFALRLGQLYNVTQPTFAIGELIYSDTATTLASLAPNTSTTQMFLSMTGTGSAGAAPVWTSFSEAVDDRVAALIQNGTNLTWTYDDPANTLTGNVTRAALTRTDDTNVTLTLGGAPTTAVLTATSITVGWTGTLAASRLNSNVVQGVTNDTNVTGSIATQNLTLGWTGTLAVSRGGSGADTLTGLLQGNGTSAFTTITNSTTVGQVLRVTGSNTYAWGALDLADGDAVTGNLPLGNGGTGAALVDPNADRILFWDDSAGAVTFLTASTGLDITTTNLTVTWATPGTIGSGTPNTGAFTTLSASGLISANGGQVAFPATQNASADANTLDDYEEGTFTPGLTVGGSATGVTFSTQTGVYTKIGRLVQFNINITLTSNGSGTGAVLVTNLPFSGAQSVCSIYIAAGTDASREWQPIVDGTVIRLRYLNGTATANATETQVTDTFTCTITGTFHV